MWGTLLGDTRISSVTTSRGEVGGGREVHEGGDICGLVADSHSCVAKANVIL